MLKVPTICVKDNIERGGALYFGTSLPVRLLSLPELLCWCLLSRGSWFICVTPPFRYPYLNNKKKSGGVRSGERSDPNPFEMTRSPKENLISAGLACDMWLVTASCWKYTIGRVENFAAVVMVVSTNMGPIIPPIITQTLF